ncbi:30S ribosomal protein S5 [Candidatus Woesearchaeota archaeon]|nr:30S ribosomal protein S5 [Candidatus Woesearchaeota archaeon]
MSERRNQQNIVKKEFNKDAWKPKTELGKKVKSGEIKDLKEILDVGGNILEAEIVDCLLPNLEIAMIDIGQSKGKFGGGKRTIWRQTQKKTKEGNKPKFATMVIIGNRDGFIGIGKGKSKETMPAREKATRQAKLNVQMIVRGNGSWEGGKGQTNSIPFKVFGKCGSSEIRLMPAPEGVGLCVEKECKKMLELAGIQNVYSKTNSQTKSKINLMMACFNALSKLSRVRVSKDYIKIGGVVEGRLQNGK